MDDKRQAGRTVHHDQTE